MKEQMYREPEHVSDELNCEHCVYFKGWSEDCPVDSCCIERATLYRNERKWRLHNAPGTSIQFPGYENNQIGGHLAQMLFNLPLSGKDEEIWRFFE